MFSQWITKWQTRENHYQLIHLRHSLCIYANKPTILIAFVNRLLFYNCLLGSRLEKKIKKFYFPDCRTIKIFWAVVITYTTNALHKVHIAPIFFIPIISYRVWGGTIYALIIKSLCCSDYFFSKNNLEQYIYLNVLD